MKALDVLGGLRLEDDRLWAQSAHPWQLEDARAVVEPSGPRWHWWLRARGMSKTTDAAGLALALLLEAPPMSRSYCYAVDQDQAGLLLDALAGIVQRTPELQRAVRIEARRVVVPETGATLAVEASDGASAFGTRPWLVVCDEVAQWPDTANHRRLWSAVVSSLPKTPGSRLIVATSAGSPTHWSFKRWTEAQKAKHWRASEVPGPSPWWSADEVEALAHDLTEAEYRRLILNQWAEADDALSTPEDIAACVTHRSFMEPKAGRQYAMGLDIGTRRDATALAVGHSEPTSAGRRVVIDRVWRWRGTRRSPVQLEEVEAGLLTAWRRYHHPTLVFDFHQAAMLVERLRKQGVHCEEYVFSTAGVNRLARTLAVTLRDRTIGLPDDPDLLDELASVRLVEGGPGTIKMTNPAGSHDDQAVVVAMVATHLIEHQPRRGGLRFRGGAPEDYVSAPVTTGKAPHLRRDMDNNAQQPGLDPPPDEPSGRRRGSGLRFYG